MILFVLQAAIIFGLLYFAPVFGSLQDTARQSAAGVIAVIGSSILLFLYDLVRAPVLIDREKSDTLEHQSREMEKLQTQSKPRVSIERILRRSDSDPVYYLEVRNPSPTEALADCFARIEEIRTAAGQIVHSHLWLHADNQPNERRFNLDPEQVKHIPICAPASGSFSFRIQRPEGGPKLPNGDYMILIHVTSPRGSPAKAVIALRGSKVTLTLP